MPAAKQLLSTYEFTGKIGMWTCNLLKDSIVDTLLQTDAFTFASAYAALIPYDPENLSPVNTDLTNSDNREELRNISKDLARIYGEAFTSEYAFKFYLGILLHEQLSNTSDWTPWNSFLERVRVSAERKYSNNSTSIEENVDNIAKLVNLNDIERCFLEFQILRTEPTFNFFYRRLFTYNPKFFVPYCLDIIVGEIPSSKSVLFTSGLVTYNPITGALPSMSRDLASLFYEGNGTLNGFMKNLCKKMEIKLSASEALGTLNVIDKDLIVSLFTNTQTNNFKGINVLLYGSKTIDKKNTAFKVLNENGFTVWNLNTKHISRSELSTRAFIVQRYLKQLVSKGKNNNVLIIEQADDVLSRKNSILSFFEGFGIIDDNEPEPAMENDEILLEENPTPSIWIVDSPEKILEENVGRFLFHCECKVASRADRRTQIEDIVKELKLPQAIQDNLSKYYRITPKQVLSAVTTASIVATNPEEKQNVILRSVYQSQRALSREHMEEIRDSVTKYSLDYINVKGAFTPLQIIEALKKKPAGTACFYGLPGAGKTQLAEYMALMLDKPIIMKRASDLLSKWVGDNEKNIANMFREAAEEDAILFLDEADSFLRDRQLAQADHQISKTNEILVQIERFKGIFICATNLFRDIDAAALRRFTFKLEFQALTEDQRWEMFKNEAGINDLNLDAVDLDHFRRKLNNIQSLTPGDFATVKRQSNILSTKLNPEQWLVQLETEAYDKLLGIERNKIGFNTGK